MPRKSAPARRVPARPDQPHALAVRLHRAAADFYALVACLDRLADVQGAAVRPLVCAALRMADSMWQLAELAEPERAVVVMVRGRDGAIRRAMTLQRVDDRTTGAALARRVAQRLGVRRVQLYHGRRPWGALDTLDAFNVPLGAALEAVVADD